MARCAKATETFRSPYERRNLLSVEPGASADVSPFFVSSVRRSPDVRERRPGNILIIFLEKRQQICFKP